MTTTSLQIDKEKILDFKNRLLTEIPNEVVEVTTPYEEFRVKYLMGFIIGYTTGKIVVTDEQTKLLVAQIIEEMEGGESEFDLVIGSDEAGKGEWLGPLTVAAVALTPKMMTKLRVEGVMDSKELRLPRIMRLAEIIKGHCDDVAVVTISPSRFNSFLQDVQREGKSLNDILAWGHATAINEIYHRLGVEEKERRIKVIIDEFDTLKTENRIQRVITEPKICLVQKPRAEEEIAVAAASILARAAREEWIDREAQRLGYDLRRIPLSEVKRMENVSDFAKTSYLHDK